MVLCHEKHICKYQIQENLCYGKLFHYLRCSQVWQKRIYVFNLSKKMQVKLLVLKSMISGPNGLVAWQFKNFFFYGACRGKLDYIWISSDPVCRWVVLLYDYCFLIRKKEPIHNQKNISILKRTMYMQNGTNPQSLQHQKKIDKRLHSPKENSVDKIIFGIWKGTSSPLKTMLDSQHFLIQLAITHSSIQSNNSLAKTF